MPVYTHYCCIMLCCSNDHRLEGSPPGVKMAGGVPGFSAPQLPRPGQKVAKKNALKIEKYVYIEFVMSLKNQECIIIFNDTI